MYSMSKRVKTETNQQKSDVFDVIESVKQFETIDETVKDLRTNGNQSIVKEIVDKRILNGKVEYRVKYTKHQWIDKESHDFREMIDSYEQSLRDNNRENNEVIDENESIQTNTDYKRDSFDDRVCDDLSEVLLSYLSFEDKFGFECISKQWKSLVFNKQKVLQINFGEIGLVLEKGNFNCKAFEEILLKCKRIDSIDISFQRFEDFYGNKISVEDKTSILSLITKHCNDLKSIRYDFTDINIETIESFCKKFGKSLVVLENSFPQSMEQTEALLSFCNKLVSIKGINFYDLFDTNGELILLTDKLESLNTEIVLEDFQGFEVLINKYKQTIKVLSIEFYSGKYLEKFLIQLSNIINLRILNIEFHVELNNNELIDKLDNSLALISGKCKKLEKLSINLSFGSHINTLQFKLITRFIQIKYLAIDSDLFRDENGYQLSIKSFKDLKNLTHLTVKNVVRDDDFYENIDQYLPQLRVLKVHHEFDDAIDLSELTFNYLSKLTNIEKLEINKDLVFKVQAFEHLINSWKQIKSIKLIGYNHSQCFTKKTIDSLISLAVKRPQIQFRFRFCVSENISSYYYKLFNKPNNIVIKF